MDNLQSDKLEQLKQFITQSQSNGQTIEQIKTTLLKAGWKAEVMDSVLSDVSITSEGSLKKSSIKWWKTKKGIFVLLSQILPTTAATMLISIVVRTIGENKLLIATGAEMIAPLVLGFYLISGVAILTFFSPSHLMVFGRGILRRVSRG